MKFYFDKLIEIKQIINKKIFSYYFLNLNEIAEITYSMYFILDHFSEQKYINLIINFNNNFHSNYIIFITVNSMYLIVFVIRVSHLVTLF